MKNLILILILVGGCLISPVRSNAAPLICAATLNDNTSVLVPVLGTSCSAAFVAKKTGSVPGLTNGQCLQVISGDIGLGSCGTSGAATLAGDNAFTGNNTFGNSGTYSAPIKVLGGFAGTGKSGFGFYTLGSSATDSCSGIVGQYVDLVVDIGGAYNGPAMTIDHSGFVGLCKNLFLGGNLLSSNGSISAASLNSSGGILLSNSGTYADYTGGGGAATMSLGQTGAPSGACVSGSIYTRNDGSVGSTFYACESSLWVAATTP